MLISMLQSKQFNVNPDLNKILKINGLQESKLK